MDKTTIQTATVDRVVQVIAALAILWALGNIAQSI
jgi:hypothetical protein